MIDVQEEKNTYLANFSRFEREAGAGGPPGLHRLRKAALKRFTELGFPTLRNEDWRFTNVAALAQIPFKLASRPHEHGLMVEQLERAGLPAGNYPRLVFVNGWYAPELSARGTLPEGVTVGSLAQALETHPEWVEPHLARYARHQDLAFTALNTAFIRDGAFVRVPKGTVVEEPVYLLFVTTTAGEASVAHPRNLILAGESSQLTLVEAYLGLEDEVYFTNAVTELAVGENAVLDHYKLQRESEEAFHIANTQIYQARSSVLCSHYMGFGGALVRNEVRALLDAPGCECTLNGLYLAAGRQHMDNHTVIDHARPHCASHELYKGILDGKAHGVFNGKIFVRQDAQKTDAKQTNQTLLLSDDATINTKPQLEIYADDVKCTHGATVGNLNADQLFYLRSRGLDVEAARALLIFAFANDIVGRVRVEALRERLERKLVSGEW
jgi:Fe-S cluster assembly protein SufD